MSGKFIALTQVTSNNFNQIILIEKSCSGINFKERSKESVADFKKSVLASGDFSQFALVNDIPVGCIICTMGPSGSDVAASVKSSGKEVLVKNIHVLKEYQNLGLETLMLNHVLETAGSQKMSAVALTKPGAAFANAGDTTADTVSGEVKEDLTNQAGYGMLLEETFAKLSLDGFQESENKWIKSF